MKEVQRSVCILFNLFILFYDKNSVAYSFDPHCKYGSLNKSKNVVCWCLANSAKMGLVETRLAIIPGAGQYVFFVL